MLFCCGKFDANEILHLKSKNGYFRRKLETGYCSICLNKVVLLSETNLITGEIKIDSAKKRKADVLYKKHSGEVDYNGNKVINGKKSNMNYFYGINIPKINKSGDVIKIVQKVSDFNGSKTTVKTIYP